MISKIWTANRANNVGTRFQDSEEENKYPLVGILNITAKEKWLIE